jgi:hypothetical protein
VRLFYSLENATHNFTATLEILRKALDRPTANHMKRGLTIYIGQETLSRIRHLLSLLVCIRLYVICSYSWLIYTSSSMDGRQVAVARFREDLERDSAYPQRNRALETVSYDSLLELPWVIWHRTITRHGLLIPFDFICVNLLLPHSYRKAVCNMVE